MTVHDTDLRRKIQWNSLLLPFMGVLVSCALLLAAHLEADRQQRTRMDSFRDRLTDLAIISESIIAGQIREFDNSLLVLRDAYAADPNRFAESIHLLRSGPLADRDLLVVLVDREGYLAYTDTPHVKPRLFLGDRPYFRFFADGGKDSLYIDEPTFGRVTKRYTLPLARPIIDRQGGFLGVVALSVRQDSLANFEPRLQLSGGTTITVINHGGALVSRSRELAKFQGTQLTPKQLAPLLIGRGGVFEKRATSDEAEQIVAYQHIAGQGKPLIVYVETSAEDALHEVALQRIVLMSAAVLLSLGILILIAVYLKGRKTSFLLIDTLRRSKKTEYEILTGTSLDGFWIVDTSGRIRDSNDTFSAMLGYSKEEILSLSLLDVEASPTPEKLAERIQRGQEKGSDRFQSRYRRKDGSIIDVELSCQYVRDVGGRFFVFTRDITERKRAEEALKALSVRQDAILSAVPDIMVEIDTKKRIIWLNPAGTDFFGDDALGKEAAAFFVGRQDTSERMQAIFAGTEETVSIESWQRRQDGEGRLLAWRYRMLVDEHGSVKGALATARDITEFNQAQEERREHIWFLENLERVDRVIKKETQIDQMLHHIIETVYSIFKCDRAWLLFPCDPEASAFRVPVEITRPEYPGAAILNVDIPMSPEEAENMREALASNDPVTHTDGTDRPVTTAKMFGVLSQMFISVFPKLGAPWLFGMHQCSHPRNWTEIEKNLFREIGRRIADGLSTFLYMRDLRDNEERFRATFEQAAVGIAHIAADGRWLRVNQKLCDILGYPREELLQQSFQNIISYEDLEDGIESFHRLLAGEIRTNSMIIRCMRKEGQIVWTNLTVSAVRNIASDPAYFIAVIEDISDRLQAEANLHKSESHLRTLVQTIPDLIWLKDQDGHYLSCNQTFERLFGARQADIVGKSDYDFVDRQLADFFRAHDRMAIAAGKPTSNEEWVTFADDGHAALLETIKTPMYDERGTLIGVLGIGHDITARKKAEEDNIKLQTQLQQSQKMDAIGQLAGGVAHDFNNMLGVILGHAELALEVIDPALPVRIDLEEIRKAASRSAEITRQLLAFARKQTAAPKVINLNEIIEGMLKMLRRLIGEDIDLAWLAASGLWSVRIDPSQIDQILANLCVNARAAIAGVGKMTVETGNSLFDDEYCQAHSEFTPGEYVRMSVSDSGCGMDKETLGHIFEPFFTTKGIGEGTGLGLAMVYGIVKQNSGFINVYSEPGEGTTFSVYLPRHVDDSLQALAAAPAAPLAHGDETILLVEDELTILKLTMMMLQGLGYTVLTANSPEEAIRTVEEFAGKIHLVLTDVIMPGMNGSDLVQRLQAKLPALKCLFMSGYTANIISRQSTLAENVSFLGKPFSKNELAAKVREVLDSRS